MTGHSVRGTRGFVAKEGANFDARLNVPLHSDELDLARALKRPEDSLADVMRLAFRQWLKRECAKRRKPAAHVVFTDVWVNGERGHINDE